MENGNFCVVTFAKKIDRTYPWENGFSEPLDILSVFYLSFYLVVYIYYTID